MDQRLVHALESRAVLGYVDDVLPSQGSVLDMPAGCGRFTEPLVRRGFDVTAVDAKQDRLDDLAAHIGGDVEVLCLRGENLPFEDDHFDLSICVRLFQHIRARDQRVAILRQLARVARSGIVATVYMESPLHRFIHALRKHKRLARYNDASLAEEFAEAGLSIQRIARPIPGHAQAVVYATSA